MPVQLIDFLLFPLTEKYAWMLAVGLPSQIWHKCVIVYICRALWVLSISNVCYSPHSPLKDVLCQQRRGKGIEPITSRVWKYCKFDQERGKEWGHLSVGVDRSNFRGMFDLVHLIYGNGFLKTKVCWIKEISTTLIFFGGKIKNRKFLSEYFLYRPFIQVRHRSVSLLIWSSVRRMCPPTSMTASGK